MAQIDEPHTILISFAKRTAQIDEPHTILICFAQRTAHVNKPHTIQLVSHNEWLKLTNRTPF